MNAPVLHILPQDGIGGAELAAHSAAALNDQVHLLFLVADAQDHPARRVTHGGARWFFSIHALRMVLANFDQIQPQVVVFSLWKSLPALLILRLLRPKLNAVLLLHAARATHFADYFCTAVMARLANAVWADCARSGERVADAKVISFLLRNTKGQVQAAPTPNFIFWGRLAPVKNLTRALDLFAEISRTLPAAPFTVIGPDGGERDRLVAYAAQLGLQKQVHFVGAKTWPEIANLAKDHSFYLQLSHIEGMAMSVAEAMQLGLVPIVTPVGEIARYCHHGVNAVIYSTIETTAQVVLNLLQDGAQYQQCALAAQQQWQGCKTYAEDFFDASQWQIDANSRNIKHGN